MQSTQKQHGLDEQGRPKIKVSDQGYQMIETHVLEIARIFFVSFGQPESQLWMKAFYWAESHYPAPYGATLAHAVLTMLNEMRICRPHTFNYTDPRCLDCSAFMTNEEKYLMDMFRHLRNGNQSRARLSAMLLCEGNDPSNLLNATIRLVNTPYRMAREQSA